MTAWHLKKEKIHLSRNVDKTTYLCRLKSQRNENPNTLPTKLRNNTLQFSSRAQDLAAADLTSAGADAQLFWSPLEKLINRRRTERHKIKL